MVEKCKKLIFVTLCTNILDLFSCLIWWILGLKVDPSIWIQIQIKLEISEGYIEQEHRHCWKLLFPEKIRRFCEKKVHIEGRDEATSALNGLR